MKSDNKRKYFGKDLEAMSFARNYHQWVLDEFKGYLGDRLAEVGAGSGNFSQLLIAEDIRHLVAFEPSANMYPILQDRLQGHKHVEMVNDFFGDAYHHYTNHFDTILYNNVLEHVEDDKRELFYVHQALRDQGYLLVFVPALSWLYSDFDRHLGHFRRYHKQDLVDLVKTARFNIIKVKYFDLAGIIPWYIAFVLLKQSITGGSVSLYDRFMVPIMRRIEGIIPPPIGKNLLLVAQKAKHTS